MFFLYLGVISTGFVVGRTVASTLFLHRLDKAYLPYTYAAVAIAISLASALYTQVSGRLRRDHMFAVTLCIYMLGLLSLRVLLSIAPESLVVVGSIYVFVDVMSILCITQFWTLACDVFTTREAKRVFSFIGGGSAVAMFAFGALVRGVVRDIGTANLMWVMIAEVAICAVILWRIGRIFSVQLGEIQSKSDSVRENRSKKTTASSSHGFIADVARLLRLNHLATIAAITAVMAVVITFIDYQWKLSARTVFAGDEDGLAAYFSLYNLFIGFAACFIQFFLTGRILEKLGIMTALMLLPVSLFFASGAILMASATTVVLWAATGAAGANALLRFTVQNTTVQLFFRPVSAEFRPRAQAMIEGILKPVVTGLTGLAIAGAAFFMDARDLSYVVLVGLLLWFFLNIKAKKQYVWALVERIKNRRLDLDGSRVPTDEATITVLRETLRGEDEGAIVNALELLHSIPERKWSSDVVHLLESGSSRLRTLALRHLEEFAGPEFLDSIRATLNDADPEVRAAAVHATCSVMGEECLAVMEPTLRDDDVRVNSAAAAGIIRYCSPASARAAHEHLARLAIHDDPVIRGEVARALAAAGAGTDVALLVSLVRDPDPEVRMVATEASGGVDAPELVEALIANLADQRTARAANNSLVKLDSTALGVLADSLKDPGTPLAVRTKIPRVLSEIGQPVCVKILLENLDTPKAGLRTIIAASAGRLARRGLAENVDAEYVNGLCMREVREYFLRTVFQCDIGIPEGTLLNDGLEMAKRSCRQRIIDLLGIAYRDQNFVAIFQGFGSSLTAVRSDAIELLDNTLQGPERPLIISVFEARSIEDQCIMARRYWPEFGTENRFHRLRHLVRGDDSWLAAAALHFAGTEGLAEMADTALEVLESRNQFKAQTALGTLGFILDQTAYGKLLETSSQDSRALVATYASARLKGENMLTIVERVLFLKSVDLFARIPGPVLSRVAEIAREELYDEGSVVIEQGEAGKGLFVILSGAARLTVNGVEVAVLRNSDFFGEMSLFDAAPTSATVEAQTDLDVLKIEPQDFSDLMAERVEISHGLIAVLIRRLRAADARKAERGN